MPDEKFDRAAGGFMDTAALMKNLPLRLARTTARGQWVLSMLAMRPCFLVIHSVERMTFHQPTTQFNNRDAAD